jgi:hypothetical protein
MNILRCLGCDRFLLNCRCVEIAELQRQSERKRLQWEREWREFVIEEAERRRRQKGG